MITQDRLKEVLFYDPETGLFVWLVFKGTRGKPGHIAGCLRNGYVTITVDGTDYYGHQLAWLYVHGEFVARLDHENRKRFDNRITNLRKASYAQNRWNTDIQKNNTSGYRGVSLNKREQKYEASIMVNKTKLFLGLFDYAEDASHAYEQAAIEHFSEFKKR